LAGTAVEESSIGPRRALAYYDHVRESGFRYDDPEVGIDWATDLELQTAARDRAAPQLTELEGRLPFSRQA
jgi:dTDP-4-dehydrorhamnose 3,5-epimerase